MTDSQKYYVTTSNFRSLVFMSEVEVAGNILEMYRQVFDEVDLTPYISHREVKSLLKSIIFLQKSESYLEGLKKKNQEATAQIKKLDSPSKLLFLAGAPKYHENLRCKTLRSDFENFAVPDEIEIRGSDEVKKFREFSRQNRKLLSEGREDVFQLRLRSQFSLSQPLGKISAPNSGAATLEIDDAIEIDQILAGIHKAIAKLENFKNTEEGKQAIKRRMFASTRALFDGTKLSDVESELLETKRQLINLVLDYHVKKEKDGAIVYSAEFLALHGFEPCGICCSHGVDFYF